MFIQASAIYNITHGYISTINASNAIGKALEEETIFDCDFYYDIMPIANDKMAFEIEENHIFYSVGEASRFIVEYANQNGGYYVL